MFAPLLVIWLPMMDLAVSIVRRRVAGRPIFSADRAHIHHRLLDRGVTSIQAVLMMYAWGLCGGVFALLFGDPALHAWQGLVVAAFFAITFLGVHQLRYAEFNWRHS